jgi:hypothetical protein
VKYKVRKKGSFTLPNVHIYFTLKLKMLFSKKI